MFKGLAATDLNPNFRVDLVALSMIPAPLVATLAELLVEDSKNLTPTATSSLAKEVSKRLQVPFDQALSLTRAGRSFAVRLARNDDNSDYVADDLIEMQVVPPISRDVFVTFLTALRLHRAELTGRANRQGAVIGGGYHLGRWAVFTDYRVAFDRFDITDVDLETYQPSVSGLIPVVTLELELHMGDDEKTIALRLPEPDLVKLEQALKVARLQLAAAQNQFSGGH
jgi:hypothetical protein